MNKNNIFIMETKGLHLKGNDDTEYKTRLFELLTDYYQKLNNVKKQKLKSENDINLSLQILQEDTWLKELSNFIQS